MFQAQLLALKDTPSAHICYLASNVLFLASRKMKIVITGGAGFVGSNLCINFKKQFPGYSVYAFDNLKRRGSELNIRRLKEHEVQFIHGDIRNREDLDVFDGVDVIIDACADPSVLSGINSPVYPLINSNLFGTVNCLELADKHKAAFVFLSTSTLIKSQKIKIFLRFFHFWQFGLEFTF